MDLASLFLNRVIGMVQPKGFLSCRGIPTPIPISCGMGCVGSHGIKYGCGGCSFCSGPGQGSLSPKKVCSRQVLHASLVQLHVIVWIWPQDHVLRGGTQEPGRRL